MKTGLRRIRYFLELSETLNFHRAAHALGITQPALSRAIGQLEIEVGFVLFERDNRKVALTDAGQVFVEGARNALNTLQESQQRCIKIAQGEGGNLFIGYTGIAISGESSTYIRSFRSCFPDVRLNLRAAWSEALIDLLKSKALDVGFITGAALDDDLEHFCVQRDALHVLLPSQHPLAARDNVRMHDLKGHEFILGDDSKWRRYNSRLYALCRDAGFEPNVLQTGPDTASILGLVGCGMGITILPSINRSNDDSATVSRPIVDCLEKLETHVVWRKKENSPLVAAFVDFLRESRHAG